jgi:hypothetical protein
MTKTLFAGLFVAMLALNFGASAAEPKSVPKAATATQDASAPPVKKSTTGICHAAGSSYYGRTLSFTPFATMAECIRSGRRFPKRQVESKRDGV